GVTLDGARMHATRIRAPLRAGQAERILGFRLVLGVADQRDARCRGNVEYELGVRDVAARRRMVAVAVGDALDRGNDGAHVRRARAELDAEHARAVAASARGDDEV